MRIAQIADMHLSRTHGYFVQNWRVVLENLNADPPDLVVLSGDVSFNGADSRDDLEFAKAELERISTSRVVVPGNHDIGDHPRVSKLDQPANEERLRRWVDIFGDDRFRRELGCWRIIGFDTEILGSGLPQEEEQWEWLCDELADNASPIVLFMHKPLFAQSPHERQFYGSCVNPDSRERLWPLLVKSSVQLIASAHVHVYRDVTENNIEFVWSPATSFINTYRKSVFGGLRRAGYVEYQLPDAGAGSSPLHKLVEPARLVNYDLRNWFRDNTSTVTLPPLPWGEPRWSTCSNPL